MPILTNIPNWLIYVIVGGGQGLGCLGIIFWAFRAISKDEESLRNRKTRKRLSRD